MCMLLWDYCGSALEIREAGLTGTIPNTITALTNLENILLNDNRLTGPIPELCGFYKLRLLYLRRNDLSGTYVRAVCACLCLLACLLA